VSDSSGLRWGENAIEARHRMEGEERCETQCRKTSRQAGSAGTKGRGREALQLSITWEGRGIRINHRESFMF